MTVPSLDLNFERHMSLSPFVCVQ